MTDEELIAYLRLQGLDKDIAAADRIKALIAERDALFRRATLAEEWRDHDKTRAEAAESKLEKAVELLKLYVDIDDVGGCERATLAEIKGESQ